MAIAQLRTLDFVNSTKIINLPDGVNAQDPATLNQLNNVASGLAWKDSVRVASTANVSLAGPGATIDGITMATSDRVLLKNQTAPAENGIYIWNGAAVAMTRSIDTNTALSLEGAVVSVEEGTANGGSTFRQTAVNFTLGTGAVTWATFGTGSPAATTTTAGIVQLATQAEADLGIDPNKVLTPATLASSIYASKKFFANIGDGTATSYLVTHNLNSFDVDVEVYRNSGNRDTVTVEVQRTSVNAITVLFDPPAPAANAFRVTVKL